MSITQEADRLLRANGYWSYTTDAIDRREITYRKHLNACVDSAPRPTAPWSETDAECLREICLSIELDMQTALAMQYRSMGWTVREISELVQMKEPTTASRIRRAIRRLAEEIQQEDMPRRRETTMWTGWWIVRRECHLLDMRSWWPEFADKVRANRQRPRH